jgi:hypothetical protein
MYAINSLSDVYYFVTPAQNRTVCGLGVVPIVIERTAHTSSLHLVTERPEKRHLNTAKGLRARDEHNSDTGFRHDLRRDLTFKLSVGVNLACPSLVTVVAVRASQLCL